MTTRTISFHFDKAPGSLKSNFLEAREGSVLIHVNLDDITTAVSTIFNRLIARDKAVFEPPLFSFKEGFMVTLIINPDRTSLEIDPMNPDEVPITLKKLKKETADLFLNAIKGTKSAVSPISTPSSASVPAPRNIIATVAPSRPAQDPFTDIFITMNGRFTDTIIERSNNARQNFGDYLMERLFIHAASYHYDSKTCEFTMTFDQKCEFKLAKLPENIFDNETKEGLAKLKDSILTFPTVVKGSFTEKKVTAKSKELTIKSVTFEPGALTIKWPNSWTGAEAKLVEMYESQDETITMLVKYGKLPATLISVKAQDFVNFVECNN